MAEELIHVLGKAGGLRVAGRASSFAFRGTDPDAREVGQKLNVGAVLEGSLQRSGDTLRVIARLVDAGSDSTLWSQQYDKSVRDVFALQDELTASIVRELRVHLAAAGSAAGPAGTADVEAYEFYLQGRYAWNQRTPESVRRAIEFFKRSIACDSNYARAYAGLADAYNVQGALLYEPFAAVQAQAKAAAMKALALDPDLAEAHTALGFVLMFYDWDGDGAKRELERAIALDPNYPYARLFYGYYLQGWGSADSALGQVRRGYELDPLNLTMNLRYGDGLQAVLQFKAAIAQYRHTFALDSLFPLLRGEIGYTFALEGQFDSARRELAKLDRPGRPFAGGERIFTYARGGFRDSALAALATLRRNGAAYPMLDQDLMRAYLSLNDRDSAFAALDRAAEKRMPTATLIATDPVLVEVRTDPRFIALLRRIRSPK
jgi:tetratricopeptide (TPR) repeat protein